MTIPNTARKAGPLLGTGSQTAWPFTFKVFAAGDVQVTIANSSGTETLLVLGTDYTVTLNSNQETSPGGTVNYPISGSALPVGSVLAIIGDLDYDQPLDLPSGGNFSPTALENQLDRSTMQIQQLREEMNRTAKLPPTSSESVEELVDDLQRIADSADNLDTVAENITSVNVVAADLSEPVSEINTVASNIANVNAVGNNIANVNTVAGISANVTTVAGIAANVTAVAGNAANINAVAGNAANITVVAGIDDDIITVAANVADVTNFADVYQGPKASDPTLRNNGSTLQAGDLYFNTVDNALRAYSGTLWVAGTAGTVTVQQFSGNGSATGFTLASAPSGENNTQVFIGGVYQQKDQYSLSGSTLTFASAPPSGTNNIEVVVIATLALGQTDAALVSFLQAGAGAIARTMLPKGREWISPADFGAVGDSNSSGSAGTNDSAAFALLEAAHTNKTVNLAGKYYLVSSPVPHANQYINGVFVVDASSTDDQPGNFALGDGAFISNTFVPRQHSSSTLTWASGNFNTAIGANTMRLNTTGRRNTAFGSQAMYSNTTGYYNTAVGSFAQYNITTGNYNVAVGNQCQQYITSGSSNVAVGNGTMVNAANGSDNTAVGDTSLTATTNRNVAIGKQAGWQNTGNDCVAIGYQALSNPVASGLYNVVIGNAAGGGISTGNSNTALGRRALSASNTGSSNTALGNDAMVSAGNGSSNTAVGSSALPNNTTGYQNVAIGVNALTVNSTGFNNVAVGRYAAQANTEGAGNVSVGEQSLASNTTGNYNTAIGTGASSGGTANSNTTSVGYQAACTGSNQVTLGNSSVGALRCQVALTVLSDERDKTKLGPVPGISFVRDLKAFVAKWSKRDGSENPDGTFSSLSAQNLHATQIKHGVNLGLVNDTDPERLEATYERLIPVLVQAILDLDAEVNLLKK